MRVRFGRGQRPLKTGEWQDAFETCGPKRGLIENDLPERPMPPRLDPARFNAASGAIRTWNELKNSEIEALLKEVNETNQKLLEVIEAKERGGASA